MTTNLSPSPVHDLQSFWDDTSDGKLRRKSQRSPPKRKLPTNRDASQFQPQFQENTPPNSPDSEDGGDESFKESTLTYITSPTGRRALEMAPLTPPPKASSPVRERSWDVSGANSILHASWPRPPSSIPSSPGPSPTSSTYSNNGHGHRGPPSPIPSLTPSSSSKRMDFNHSRPFQDSGIPTPITPSPPRVPPKSVLKHVIKRTSGGSMRSMDSSREGNYGLRPEDVIYMTVVKEISS